MLAKVRFFGCALLLLWPALLPAQDDQDITNLKMFVGFSSWPGKAGPLKRGLNFQIGDYGMLSGFVAASSSSNFNVLQFGLLQTTHLTRGSEALDVTIGVAFDSTDNGQELFLRSFLRPSEFAIEDHLTRGDLSGFAIGNVNFVRQAATSTDAKGQIAFVRNNVVCILSDGGPDAPTLVNLIQLATSIDSNIQAANSLLSPQFNALRPQINTFSSADSTLQATGSAATTLNVSISDPGVPSKPITRQFDSQGKFTIQDTGALITVRPSGATGLLPIQLIAINSFLQFSTSTIFITVNP